MTSTNFTPPNQLIEDWPRIRQALTAAGQPWAVFGGAAVAAFQPTRPIHDYDLITTLTALPAAANRLGVNLVTDEYHQPVIRLGTVDIYGPLTIRTPIGPCRFELDSAMTQRLELRSIPLVPWPVPIVSREDNIVLKAILQRGPHDGKQDGADIRSLEQVGPLDLAYLQWRIDRCAARGYADQFLQHIGILV